jgi:hypothetical protein
VLARYQILRGKRPPDDPLPSGVRLDVRKHVHHVLSPNAGSVVKLLDDPTPTAFRAFAREYEALLVARFREDRAPFDALAERASAEDVYIGCSCPTRKNPDVNRCHTVLALRFMKKKYPKLRVVFP